MPKTFEEYADKCENEDGYRNHMKELESLKKHFDNRYLSKNLQINDTRSKKRGGWSNRRFAPCGYKSLTTLDQISNH